MLKYVLLFVMPMLSLGCLQNQAQKSTEAPGKKAEIKEVMDAAVSFSRHEKTDSDVEGIFSRLDAHDYKDLAKERDQSKTFAYFMLTGKASDKVKNILGTFTKGLDASEVEAQLNTSMNALRATRASDEKPADLHKLIVFVLSTKASEVNNIKDASGKFAPQDFIKTFAAVHGTNDKALEDKVIKAVDKDGFNAFVAWMEHNLALAKLVFKEFYRNAAKADQVVLENQALWAAYQDTEPAGGIPWLLTYIDDYGFAHKITSGAKTFKLKSRFEERPDHRGTFLYVLTKRAVEDMAMVAELHVEAGIVLTADNFKYITRKIKGLFPNADAYKRYAGDPTLAPAEMAEPEGGEAPGGEHGEEGAGEAPVEEEAPVGEEGAGEAPVEEGVPAGEEGAEVAAKTPYQVLRYVGRRDDEQVRLDLSLDAPVVIGGEEAPLAEGEEVPVADAEAPEGPVVEEVPFAADMLPGHGDGAH